MLPTRPETESPAAKNNSEARKPTPFFIFGCQRSGTTIAVEVMSRCPEIDVYEELDPRATEVILQSPPFEDRRLRGPSEIAKIIREARTPIVLFKPLMDSQFADLILRRHDGQGLWFFRHYADVANSAVALWGQHQWELCYDIRHDQWGRRGWRVERMSAETIGRIKDLWRPDLSPHEGAALFWFTRNVLFYEQELDRRQDVMLVPYELAVADPRAWFGKIFDKMGIQISEHYIGEVKPTSVGKQPPPKLAPSIQALCDELLERLGKDAARQSAATIRSDAPVESA